MCTHKSVIASIDIKRMRSIKCITRTAKFMTAFLGYP